MDAIADPLIAPYLDWIARACGPAPALDLACGSGRNGLALLAAGIPVVFADRDGERLGQIRTRLQAQPYRQQRHLAQLWPVDFEVPGARPLVPESYGAILVFRYLHRPLMDAIKTALVPGGLLLYETFTREQTRFGRPRNPDFLLDRGELESCFSDWDILHRFEGIESDPASGTSRAIAQLVASRPGA